MSLLNKQLNGLYSLYQEDYSNLLKIPGVAQLGPMERKVMLLFEEQDILSVKEVVQRLNLPNSTVTSVVKRIIGKNLLTREVMASDRRALNLKLTKSGREIITYNKYLKRQFSESILESLDTLNEQKQLIELLEKAVQSLKHVKDDHLRRGFMNNLKKEYNEFGPWLMAVESIEEIPQQFVSHKELILSADFSFKVPIGEDRRKLRPGMLMYSTVVSIFGESLLVLKATNDGVTDYKIPFEDVRSLTVSHNLLDSHLIIDTDNKSYDIDYNSVSTDVSEKVVELLRNRIFTAVTKGNLEAVMDKEIIDAKRYKSMVGHMLDNETFKVLAYQPAITIEKIYKNQAEALLAGFKKYDLQDVLFIAGEKALVVVDSVKEVKRANEADYSYRYVFIQTDLIKEIEMADELTMHHLKKLILHVGEAQMGFLVSDEFDQTGLVRYLNL